jgi:outer membrane protein assembly factor BamB
MKTYQIIRWFFNSTMGIFVIISTWLVFGLSFASQRNSNAEMQKSPGSMLRLPAAKNISTGAWLTFMGNCHRTGNVEQTAGPKVGGKIWTFRENTFPAPFAASPAVYGDSVYVGSDNGKLYCLDAFTGEVRWEFEAEYEIFASPAVADGRVYVGEGLHYTGDAKLYCLDASTGKLLWDFQTSSHVEFGPTLFDGKVYFGAGEDGVYCCDAQSGQKLWQYKDVHVDMSPAVTAQGVFFGNVYGEPSFYRLNMEDGKLLWKKPAPYGVCGSPSTDGQRVYFGLGNGTFNMSHAQPEGSVWCLSVAEGSEVWRREVRDAVLTTVALSQKLAYFGSRDGRLYCVDAMSGEIHWSFNTDEPVLSSPAVVGGLVYLGSDDGYFYCLDAASGEEVWKYDTSEVSFSADARVISSPAVANNRVYVGSMNYFFFCLGDATPKSN